ncbi:hypothetical protein [Parasitella parasitica]|uniref:Protein S-acyltransferase n=1 Tax=Parasitella parasitica TaxID=35722 RepID=A0A0B7NL97_9FUNG|nr:hypothetical protein [Parasitella parasitica]
MSRNDNKHRRYQDNKPSLKSKNQRTRLDFAKHATITNHQGPITVQHATDACLRWITIVLGSIIASIYLFILLSCRLAQLVRDMRHNDIRPTALESAFLSINLILTTTIMITVGILTTYHVYCISTNTTTIEGWEKGRSLTIKGMGKIQNIKCPYDQGIYKNVQSVLGRWPILWLVPRSISGTGLDFPISTKYMDQDAESIIIEKTFSSSASLNRTASINSQWTSTTNTPHSSHDENEPIKVDITPLKPLKTKPSINTIGSRSIPNTPGSVLTFASTATTLVDNYSHKPATKSNKMASEEMSDYSISPQHHHYR